MVRVSAPCPSARNTFFSRVRWEGWTLSSLCARRSRTTPGIVLARIPSGKKSSTPKQLYYLVICFAQEISLNSRDTYRFGPTDGGSNVRATAQSHGMVWRAAWLQCLGTRTWFVSSALETSHVQRLARRVSLQRRWAILTC